MHLNLILLDVLMYFTCDKYASCVIRTSNDVMLIVSHNIQLVLLPQVKQSEPLSTSETVSDETVREVRGPEYVQAKPSEEPSLFTALKVQTPTVIREVDQVLDQVELAEFGPAEWPLRELATISVLTRHGISTEQVYT